MIKINLSKDIIRKHVNYIIESNIRKNIETLKESEEILQILSEKYGEDFKEEHIKFCKYILEHITNLNEIENNLKDIESNIFISSPNALNEIIHDINNKFPIIFNEIYNNSEDIYNKYILDSFGYKKFSGMDMIGYYDLENNFLQKYSSKLKTTNLLDYLSDEIYHERLHDTKQNIFIRNLLNELENIISLNIDNYKIKIIFEEIRNELRRLDINMTERKFILKINSIFKTYKKSFSEEVPEKVINLQNYNLYCKRNNLGINNWSAYRFLLELNLKVCPYCNRQYITPIYSEAGKMRADLDHFFPKSRYPYLSMSIFNLVPSCKFCNSSLKGKKEFTYEKYINPYEHAIDDFYFFDYIPQSSDSFLGKDEFVIKLIEKDEVDKDISERCQNNINVFNLEAVYQYHSNVIKELILKKSIYTKEYIDLLLSEHSNLFETRDKIIELLIDHRDFDNTMDSNLSKLYNDIITQLEF
ncbi:HNH endonuclease [Clostridium sp. 'White wine YQ']|uniref:HNH endonuclease n=1 Tax=Clostridium sp. 'White wine YQ' TaxID=3027474 RepID=UPI002366A8DE|nr:HNH endonuclease domain-containing protein [Clostridium sp. 'White wine YQ']MDD7793716.1 HNH endonuclease domain-containing protein [Clostridium sp. 'White wine YQ']